MPSAEVILKLQSQVAPQIAATVSAYTQLSASEQKAAQSAATYAKTQTQVALTDAKVATEEQRLAVQVANVTKARAQAESATLRLANAQEKAARGSSLEAQFASGLKSGLLGIVGPAALATAALGIIVSTANSFKEAFSFKAQLDSTNASIAISLDGVRNVGQTFGQAAAFADKYKLTQEETAAAIQASIPILRSSNASLTDVESTLLRLQAKKPEKSIADAARALDELKSGQIISIVDQFNVSRDAANKMKNEIAGGADAVTVLSTYLESAGFGMEALEIRTKGATGALNDLKVAQEKLKIAQGEFASGPGIALLGAATKTTGDATKLLQGDVRGLNDALKDSGITTFSILGPLQSYNSFVLDAGRNALVWAGVIKETIPVTAQSSAAYDANVQAVTASTNALHVSADALSAEALKKLDSTIATAQLGQQQKQLDSDSRAAAQGLLGAGDQALLLAQKYGIAADQAQFLINAQQRLSNATALADQRKGEQTGTDLTANQFNKFNDLARKGDADRAADKKRADDKAAADAARLQDAQNNLNLTRAKTSAQKIAELRRQQAATTDPVERIQLQSQIEQERNSAAKSHTSELGKQLKLQESIYDSVNKQKDALLDIAELTIRDRQERRKEDREIAQAQRILANPRASAEFKAAAQDRIDLDRVHAQQRQQQLAEKGATAGGTIVNGRLLQSVPAAGGALPATRGPIVPLPAAPGAPTVTAPAAGLPTVEVLVTLDGKQIAANVVTRLRGGQRASNAAGGGQT